MKFAQLVAEHGVDLLDVSSGGNSRHQKVRLGPLWQVPFAEAVKKAHGEKILVGTVGGFTNGNDSEKVLDEVSGLLLSSA